ncbi:ABC transporter substrate-binding protein [Rhizobium mongolense]|nr:ABC transporter substrate-binding protein [Rhizobium mongolense]MBB4232954.1 peptide/nickel transport system substrate-binding protein [Rhizobium mongolense]
MTISRRDLIKTTIAAGAVLSIPSEMRAQTSLVDVRTIRMRQSTDLQVFDPIWTTSTPTAHYGAAIYDQLFALDSNFMPQPQMVGNWAISDDKRTYTFQLRDGLQWHDDTPVTASDCVASIRRWAEVSPAGQLIMARTTDISAKDKNTFTIVLKEPLSLLPSLLAEVSPPILYIMREQDASRPASEKVTSHIGSGPFKYNEALAKPGASYVYDKNEKYIPRQEPPDGLAGAKVVKVDRVVWDIISDDQTALAALQTGEVDYLDRAPVDLLPVIGSDPNLVLQVLDKAGANFILRMNFLQKPFDNVKVRRAMLHLVDQEAFLSVMHPDAEHTRVVTSIFGNETPYTNDANTGWYRKGGDPEKAKQLLKEAGYAGEKIVIMSPTDWPPYSNGSQLLVAELHKIGVNAELAVMTWAELATRRANKGPIEDGGWSIFITDFPDYVHGNPLSASDLAANGDQAWYGWPKNDEYEALRAKWPDVETLEERRELARKMQSLWWDFVGDVRLGQFISPAAHRKSLTGLIGMPQIVPMWNVQKTSA